MMYWQHTSNGADPNVSPLYHCPIVSAYLPLVPLVPLAPSQYTQKSHQPIFLLKFTVLHHVNEVLRCEGDGSRKNPRAGTGIRRTQGRTGCRAQGQRRTR